MSREGPVTLAMRPSLVPPSEMVSLPHPGALICPTCSALGRIIPGLFAPYFSMMTPLPGGTLWRAACQPGPWHGGEEGRSKGAHARVRGLSSVHQRHLPESGISKAVGFAKYPLPPFGPPPEFPLVPFLGHLGYEPSFGYSVCGAPGGPRAARGFVSCPGRDTCSAFPSTPSPGRSPGAKRPRGLWVLDACVSGKCQVTHPALQQGGRTGTIPARPRSSQPQGSAH